ncbi:MAG: Hsp20/alpha crystallin family protein [Bacteroidales bacterium]|nr:Hsp20/alpha crystallin family protein [Bacteroidales bacterium]MEA4841438.1 Hsp20/alpha crystallin family protein [Bacteroidales bacterium]
MNDSDWATSPAVNIVENKDGFRIEIAAPGLNKEDFHINIDKKVLVISSEKETKSESKDENDEKYYRREFGYFSFKRSFSLPEYADTDKIKATHENGVLNVFIPKREETKEKPARIISIE